MPDDATPTHDDHAHEHSHQHGQAHSHGRSHGHEGDRGLRAMWRYARHARRMWRSEVNDAVVGMLDPKPGETVVDIGAGVGAGVAALVPTGASVVAVEPTPYMRRILAVRRLALRHPVRVVDGAAESMPVDDRSVDGAMAVNTLHHWTDHAAAGAELARVLRPGGRAVLIDEDFDDPRHPDHDRFAADDGGHAHGFSMVDAARVAEHLRAAGLHVERSGKEDVVGRPVIAFHLTAPND